jgi:phosphoadenosine phosphosulfate reductase
MTQPNISQLNDTYATATAQEVLQYVTSRYKKEYTFASSLGVEDQVITHMLSQITENLDIFILDTGRLHQETYDLIQTTHRQYAFSYRIFFPNQTDVETMTSAHGPNHFYSSPENRKDCCFVRKVKPLTRALNGYSAWITGIRRAQSVNRAETPMFEWDNTHNILKINPLIHWSKHDVWTYVKRNDIPYNKLHDHHFPSIGCAPCTRAVDPGSDDRSGRWWWETSDKKECGLHLGDVNDT